MRIDAIYKIYNKLSLWSIF